MRKSVTRFECLKIAGGWMLAGLMFVFVALLPASARDAAVEASFREISKKRL